MTERAHFLKRELDRRIQKNSRYSMRAFAESLGVNIGTLSSLMTGKRPLTIKTAIRFCEKLHLGPRESAKILNSIYQHHQQKHLGHIIKSKTIEESLIEQEMFTVIADWYHYAILQLVETDSYKAETHHKDPKWFGHELGIPASQAKFGIERLLKVGLLKKDLNGFLVRTRIALTTQDRNKTSGALIRHQEQVREKAIESLKNDPIESRLMRSMTMAIDPSRLPEAAELIEEFQNELSELIEKTPRRQVYQLSISLFPLQKRRKS